MNYPVLNIVEPITKSDSTVIDIPKDKLLTISKIRELSAENKINLRTGGKFSHVALFIANREDLREYDFYFTIDDCGCLIVVPVKK